MTLFWPGPIKYLFERSIDSTLAQADYLSERLVDNTLALAIK